MRYKEAKNAGVRISELTVGTWGYDPYWWGEADKKSCEAALMTAVDRGVNIVDTAARYGDGGAETLLGSFLTPSRRDRVILCSKFGIYAEYPDGKLKLHRNSSYDRVIWECEQSLSRLKTDRLDVYFQHWPDNETNTPIAETMRALNDLIRQGKIRWIGFSNTSVEALQEAGKYGTVSFIQPQYSMVHRTDEALMRWCRDQGIAVVTYGSLAGGILTGAYRTLPQWPETDARYKFYDGFHEPKFSRIQELLHVMDDIAGAHHATPGQVALNWSTQRDYITSAISGFRKAARAEENCAAFDWTLSEDELARLDAELLRLGL